MAGTIAFLARAWPYLAIVGLVFVVLFMRNDLTKTTAQRDAANVRVTDLTNANQTLAQGLALVDRMQKDNDAIAAQVGAALDNNRVREVRTREIIERAAKNDPNVRSWIDTPVPSGVREALRADSIDRRPR